MATFWRVGGTPTPRSSTGTPALDNRDHQHAWDVTSGVKRRFCEAEHAMPWVDDGVLHHPQPKRRRPISDDHDFIPVTQPAYFVIKQAGTPVRSPSPVLFQWAAPWSQEESSKSPKGQPWTDAPREHRYHPVLVKRPTRGPSIFSEEDDCHDCTPAADWSSGGEVQVAVHRAIADYPRQSTLMERTSGGLSISPDPGDYDGHLQEDHILGDEEAARRVEDLYSLRLRISKTDRVLRSLISPKSPAADFEIDDDALQSIFYAANDIFFFGCLKGRVRWDWSHSSTTRYNNKVIGTTALRKAVDKGWETLIVLSQPILKDRRYNRRLLISTFLHELIHSYLFIQCGPQARRDGGHTQGFHRIARLIDDWAGPDTLFLSDMQADLRHFLAEAPLPLLDYRHHVYNSCALQCGGSEAPGPRQAIFQCRWPSYVHPRTVELTSY